MRCESYLWVVTVFLFSPNKSDLEREREGGRKKKRHTHTHTHKNYTVDSQKVRNPAFVSNYLTLNIVFILSGVLELF